MKNVCRKIARGGCSVLGRSTREQIFFYEAALLLQHHSYGTPRDFSEFQVFFDSFVNPV